MQTSLPLSLYVHIPWCVQKCPYCDFNSHAVKQGLPEQAYINALIDDLAQDIKRYHIARPLKSIFIGGGTPSLFSADAIARLLSAIKSQLPFAADIEITLEANPGTVEANKFVGFNQAGVNRLSVGVQSFVDQHLTILGRIHDCDQAKKAIEQATRSGVNSVNLDLMHGLPQQNLRQALADIDQAIKLAPQHLSWYQLTIEPNTSFYSKPPRLPDDDTLWEIHLQGLKKLADAGYQQYEISAYAQPGFQCQHNLNYWRFGDYLGIGCGAHGKITEAGKIIRTVKVKHPKGYLDQGRAYLDNEFKVGDEELPFEFMMNRLRLLEAFSVDDYCQRTGLTEASIRAPLIQARDLGLLSEQSNQWQVTEHGHRYLNNLLDLFL